MPISEKRRKYLAEWRANNRVKLRKQALRWVNDERKKDPEKFLAQARTKAKRYRENDLEKYRAKEREYSRIRRDKDREAYNRSQREYRQKNPEKFKTYTETRKDANKILARKNLLKKYGLTEERFSQMVLSQEGKCALCKTVPRRLVIDHNHETGKLRELLCDRCNFLLGFIESGLKRTAMILEMSVEYLKKHEALRD